MQLVWLYIFLYSSLVQNTEDETSLRDPKREKATQTNITSYARDIGVIFVRSLI